MSEQFISISLKDVLVGEELPCTLYVYISFRFITLRAKGDIVDRATYDRLDFKKVHTLFISDQERVVWEKWIQANPIDGKIPPLAPENQGFTRVREDIHRKTMDIFHSEHPSKIVKSTLESSKKLVDEVMKFPYAVQTLSQLQRYSRGTVDHSVNVSVLSTYLAMQMGYSHTLILQHVGMGGLLHDIGKTLVKIIDEDNDEQIAQKMVEHPSLGSKMLEEHKSVPNEVKMIVAQHHENYDGTGHPAGLRGTQIYDLARIVSIANRFDDLVGNGKGSLKDRQRKALDDMENVYYRIFDPNKLTKAIKILKQGV
ncbi:MAG: HD domain-containing protein [Xanthomonadaceae bacterium]|nr:HD domain-containing protein [Xanthomonadaceae bacterium]